MAAAKIPKPKFYLDISEYGWVSMLPNKKIALKLWEARFNRWFEISISEEWWNCYRMSSIVHEMYCRAAALAYPAIIHEIYSNPDHRPGEFKMICQGRYSK